MSPEYHAVLPASAMYVFPPALVPVLRTREILKGACLDEVGDDVLVHFVVPGGVESGAAPLYQWKVLRFNLPRPFGVGELVKLAAASIYPEIAKATTYRMTRDASLASLLTLARRLGHPKSHGESLRMADGISSGTLLRNAFLTEAQRVAEELGALTAVDGALVLDRNLALVAFGVVLPVGRQATIMEALDAGGSQYRTIDFGTRGTRHRAGATYAAEHPGSLAFVASEDGQISCMFLDLSHQHALLWNLGRGMEVVQ